MCVVHRLLKSCNNLQYRCNNCLCFNKLVLLPPHTLTLLSTVCLKVNHLRRQSHPEYFISSQQLCWISCIVQIQSKSFSFASRHSHIASSSCIVCILRWTAVCFSVTRKSSWSKTWSWSLKICLHGFDNYTTNDIGCVNFLTILTSTERNVTPHCCVAAHIYKLCHHPAANRHLFTLSI